MNQQAISTGLGRLVDFGIIGIFCVLLIFVTWILVKWLVAQNKRSLDEKDKNYETLRLDKNNHIELLRTEIRTMRESYNENIGGLIEANNHIINSCREAINENAKINEDIRGVLMKILERELNK